MKHGPEKMPLVSIICVTYNHARFIHDALASLVTQRTSFEYEIIVHDDASTDGTTEVIIEYAKRYPKLIIPIIEEQNQYSLNVDFLPKILKKCRGKYYALCEGDDFWIDPKKMELQVDYMENHPKCYMCVSNALVLNYETDRFSLYSDSTENHVLSPKEIIKKGYPTASMIYRADISIDGNSFYNEAGIGDWPLRLRVLEKGGEIYYFNRVMSFYRAWTPGSYCQRTYGNFDSSLRHVWELIKLMLNYNKATERKYEKYIITRIQYSVWDLFRISGVRLRDEFDSLLARIDKSFFDEDVVLDSRVLNILESYRYVVIYGAGYFGKKVARQILDSRNVFDCFVVSDGKEHVDNLMGKSVHVLSELRFPVDETLVVVAIEPRIWDELVDSLDKFGYRNVVCPLLYDID